MLHHTISPFHALKMFIILIKIFTYIISLSSLLCNESECHIFLWKFITRTTSADLKKHSRIICFLVVNSYMEINLGIPMIKFDSICENIIGNKNVHRVCCFCVFWICLFRVWYKYNYCIACCLHYFMPYCMKSKPSLLTYLVF